jgi:hypothetical protein
MHRLQESQRERILHTTQSWLRSLCGESFDAHHRMGKKAPQHRANAPTLGANAKGVDRLGARQRIDLAPVQSRGNT